MPATRTTRWIVGIVATMFYFTGLAFWVWSEGNSYRRDLKHRRGVSTPSAERAARDFRDETPVHRPIEPEKARPGESPSLPAGVKIAPELQIDPAITAVASKTSTTVQPLAKPRSVIDPRPANLRGLSSESLREIGDELFKVIQVEQDLVDDPPAIQRLTRLAREIEADQPAGSQTPVFHVYDSAGVNSFSHVPNHLYVSHGIFGLAQVDAELQFVIAHELAHLRLGHAQSRLEQVARGPDAQAGLAPWLHHLIALGYSDDQEFAADLWSYRALVRVGRSRREALGFLRRYRAYADEDQTIAVGRRPPRSRPGDVGQDLDNHYPSHPPAKERLARLEAAAAPAKTDRATSN